MSTEPEQRSYAWSWDDFETLKRDLKIEPQVTRLAPGKPIRSLTARPKAKHYGRMPK